MDSRLVRVLLVEDNAGDAALVREVLATSLERYELAVVQRLSAALPLAQRGACDIVLLDLSLPDAWGLQGLEALALAAPNVPILVLTGSQDDAMTAQALRKGAQDYLVKGEDGPAVVLRAMRHAIERKAFEARLVERAHFDGLTGLPNRALFCDRLDHALARAKRTRERAALLFVDLDGFKAVNDALGHDSGDEVLRMVAGELRRCVREGDTVARLGGDEFTVLLDPVSDAEAARAVAARILHAIEQPSVLSGVPVRLTASIGISVFPDHAADAAGLLRRADAAMFRAKQSGRNNALLAELTA